MKLKDLVKLPVKLIDSNSNNLTVWKRLTIESKLFYQVFSGNQTYPILITELELVELLQTYTQRSK